MSGQDARGSWGPLAEEEPRCAVAVPGAELRCQSNSLREEDDVLRWFDERIYQAPGGAWTLTRHVRSTTGEGERVEVYLGRDPGELVATVRAQLGMSPGLVEVLGRAGIEIGLEPGDEIED